VVDVAGAVDVAEEPVGAAVELPLEPGAALLSTLDADEEASRIAVVLLLGLTNDVTLKGAADEASLELGTPVLGTAEATGTFGAVWHCSVLFGGVEALEESVKSAH
jgi:hypothetical protein